MTRISVVLSAGIGLLALSGAASAGEARMPDPVTVVFETARWPFSSENHELTISMPPALQTGGLSRLVVKDRGRLVTGHWMFLDNKGCLADSVSDTDGSFPATCTSPVPITSFIAWMDRSWWPQFFSIHPSAAAVSVLVAGGPGNDELDVRDGTGNDFASCRDGIDWVWTDAGDQTKDCESTHHPNLIAGAPAVTSWMSGRLDVFWRGSANDLRHKWFESGRWFGEESLGGQLSANPAAVSWSFNRIDVFWRGTAGDLRHRAYDGQWQGEESLGGQLPIGASPAVASTGPGRLDVFWRGTGDDLRHLPYSGVSWALPDRSLGGTLVSDPEAVSWGRNRLDVFARGEGDSLSHRWNDGPGWSQWETLGSGVNSGPAVTSRGPNELDVFYRGMDGKLWKRSYANSWGPFENLGGRMTSDPAVVSWGGRRLDVFMRSPYGRLYQFTPSPA